MNVKKLLQTILASSKKNPKSIEILNAKKSSQIVKANEEAPKIFFDQIENYDEVISHLSSKMQLDLENDILRVLSLIFQNENYFDQHTIKISSVMVTPSEVILNYEVPILNEVNKISIEKCHDGKGFLYTIKYETGETFKYQCILTNDNTKSECLTTTIGNEISLVPILRLFQSWDENNAVYTCQMDQDKIKFSYWNNFFVDNNCNDASYHINLEVQKPIDEENDGYVYIPKNKEMIEAYLQNLQFPVKLEQVYKDICAISFGDEISKYPLFELYILTQKFSKKYCFADGIFTDIIRLENGKLKTFGLTYPNDTKRDNSLLAVILKSNKKIDYVQYTEEKGFKITNNANLEQAENNIGTNAICFVSAKAVRTFPELYQDILIVENNDTKTANENELTSDKFIQESFIDEQLHSDESSEKLVKKLIPQKQKRN